MPASSRVHPVCTPDCSHGRPEPAATDQRLEVDWSAVQAMITESMSHEPSAPREIVPAPYDPAAFRREPDPEPEPYPAPVVTSRDGAMEPAPRAVALLKRDLEAGGWMVALQFARGTMPHSTTGRPLAEHPSWALRMHRDGLSAVAVHRDGKWDTCYLWSATQTHRKIPGITALRALLLP